MIKVGELWTQTKITTAEEHFISNRIEKVIIERINQVEEVLNRRRTIILTSVEGEEHVISLLCLELMFSDIGYKIINIGLPLPVSSVVHYTKGLSGKPHWLFMSVTLRAYIGPFQRNLESIKSAFNDDIKIAIGVRD